MAWTTVELVRLHLIGPVGTAREIRDERLRLAGTAPSYLASLPIVPGTIVAKGILQTIPTAVSVLLEGTNWTVFASEQVVPDTVAVVDGTALRTFYIEGVDFVVDYDLGRIRRTASSSIPSGGSVGVHYFPFTLFDPEQDYDADPTNGAVARIAGSAIPDPYDVLVDYQISESGANDDLLAQAIVEAEAKITARLATQYSESSEDDLLIVGATELSCAVAAYALASKPLGISRDTAADERSQQWLDIGHNYEDAAWKTLDKYLVKPLRQPGYRVKNA